ncbi:MAG: YraN family protein [bacterium]|nr:YraN family protein [bacterium]
MWGPKPMSVWDRGERAAARFMRKHGHRVIARNLRLPHGEIDLLCVEKSTGTTVIVEVKARSYSAATTRDIDPAASITARKRAKLLSLAKSIKKDARFAARPIRIDVISVRFEQGKRGASIKHYSGCVTAS